ncbi:hypothetical protein J2Y69_002617 [Microbacterium resistens]|uniref:Asp23/Gls24 family envelope stress response protein n=1 Tax=Microbacterium resistens TaxID=156977 RepID=A0ABU1SEL2_9MICO|nr:hypothetical protein [Microbacterium resistens]MDR6868009.1 hypothetical protein [Microbacterium resistens]
MSREGRGTGSVALGFGPEDLDGHTMDELVDYLDAGRTPPDPSIEQSPGCRIALEALARLRSLGAELIDDDTAEEPPVEEDWVQRVLSGIALDARAGRRIPLDAPGPDDLGMSEGAVRGLIRAAERATPGVIVGRCRLDGDLTTFDAPVRIEVEASLPYGEPIHDIADRLRATIDAELRRHTDLVVTGIDIIVHDLRIDVGSSEEAHR